MKVVGIIAEFNPFHDGHKYLLDKVNSELNPDVIVSCMSGNVTQRGELSVYDKWKRAEEAVKNGIDLVVELPVLYSSLSARDFSKGGVEILEDLGCEFLAFGVENDNLEMLEKTASLLRDREDEIEDKIFLKKSEGISYPKARQIVLEEMTNTDLSDVLSTPNNILALEYIKNIRTMVPYPIKRMGKGYYETASDIRKNLYLNSNVVKTEDIFDLFKYRVLTTKEDELNSIFGASEGLGSKIKKDIRNVKSYEEVVNLLKSKRYTETHITRLIIHTVLGIRNEDISNRKNYIRVLAFNEKGSKYLREIKGKTNLEIVSNLGKKNMDDKFKFDILATDIYNMVRKTDLYLNSEMVKKPISVK